MADKTPKTPPTEKTPPKEKTPAEIPGKTEAVPSNYSRGEGQNPVSQAYKDNWNAIYAKKKKR